MTFRDFWSPRAEDRLEEFLRNAADAVELAGAAREIGKSLAAEPKDFGESRYDTVRIGFVRPLGVQFEVLGDVETVIVYDVWSIDRKAN